MSSHNSGKEDNFVLNNLLLLETGLRMDNTSGTGANNGTLADNGGDDTLKQMETINLYQKAAEADFRVKCLLSNLYPKSRYRTLTDSSSSSSVHSPTNSHSSLSLSSNGYESASLATLDKEPNNLSEMITKALVKAHHPLADTSDSNLTLLMGSYPPYYQLPQHHHLYNRYRDSPPFFQDDLDGVETQSSISKEPADFSDEYSTKVQDEDEISKSLKMFALFSAYDETKEASVTDYDLLKARANVDDIMKDFNSNGYTCDDPLLQNGFNNIAGSGLYRLYQMQQQQQQQQQQLQLQQQQQQQQPFSRLALAAAISDQQTEHAALMEQQSQQQKQHHFLLLQQQQQQQQQLLQREIQMGLQAEVNFLHNASAANGSGFLSYGHSAPGFGGQGSSSGSSASQNNNIAAAEGAADGGGGLGLASVTAAMSTVVPASLRISPMMDNNVATVSADTYCGGGIASGSTPPPSAPVRDKVSNVSVTSSSLAIRSKSESSRNNNATGGNKKTSKRFNQVSAKHCVFCDNNNEPEAVVKSHSVRDTFGRVLCPRLRTYVCPICKASGDLAHTVKYCPKKPIVTMEDALRADYMRLNKNSFYKQQMKV